MEHALKDLDRLLRGDATRLSSLRQGKIEISEGGLPLVIIGLGLFYGLCMGCFALANTSAAKPFFDAFLQTISSMAKVPALFLTTLVVTFPSLYVFNALVGSRLTLQSLWRLLVSALAVMVAVLSSLGPIVAFFSISTTNYPFMLLLNVAVFALSGFLGLKFLLHTLHRLTLVLYPSSSPRPLTPRVDSQGRPLPPPAFSEEESGALERLDERSLSSSVRQIFGIWVVVFGMVGMQMSWVLRPFISAPGKPFILFSARESNIYTAVWEALMRVMG